MIHVHAVVVRNIKSAAANEYNAPRPCQILGALFLPAKKYMIGSGLTHYGDKSRRLF
jgi:hypothetical protein